MWFNFGPGGNMSYLPPWAPTSGHYPPHMLPQHPVSSPSAHSPQTSHATTLPHTSPSYQNLSPVVKSAPPAASVAVTSTNNTPKSAAAPTSSATTTTSTISAVSATHSASIGDSYEPQGFHRSLTPPLKRPNIGDTVKTENSNDPSSEMLLALAGPSSMDLKSPRKFSKNAVFPPTKTEERISEEQSGFMPNRGCVNQIFGARSPGKYPAPEQLPSPVMFSYQGRGRPRKNWTHATGLPTMIPVTHPPVHPGPADDQDDEENKPFKCNICGKGFKLKGGLMQHERTHSTDRPYVCPDCGKLFRQPTHLQQHLRIHTGEKPYECAFCDKTFRQRTILNQHLRIHTGEKPYACMECGKQFRQKAILDQHFRTHLGEKPYACPHPACRKHFREMATLISHMKCHKDVPDPRIVLQQAKRLIKEERQDEHLLGIENRENPERISLHERMVAEGQERVMGQERLEQDRIMNQERLGQERGLSHDRVEEERRMSQEGNQQHEQRDSGCSSTEASSYQRNNEPIRQDHRSFPPSQSTGENSSSQKSPHPLPTQHPPTDHPNDNSRTPQQSQPSPVASNMMASAPQMAMANLIPYPHSIFPSASYMMPHPDPRDYHHQIQGGQHPQRQ